MKGTLSVTVGVLIGLLAMDSEAGFREGMAALDADDYQTAFRELRPVAEKGDAVAQHQIGVMYFLGKGVTQNYGEAARWYRRAAERGLAAGELNLGNMYLRGQGVPLDYGEALKLLLSAAQKGQEIAALRVGDIYRDGLGVSVDSTVALEWYRKAAERDYPLGEHRVGNFYWVGRGTAQNVSEARKWLHKAADQGYAPSQADLSLIYFRGDGGTKVDYQAACFWSQLAVKKLETEDYRKGATLVQKEACGKLSGPERQAITRRVSEWKPDEVWRNRERRELEERRKLWAERTD